jgi:hypothetical protein
MAYTRVRDPFARAVDSLNTVALSHQTSSNWCWVGDYAQLSVSVCNNSVVTIYGTDSDLWKATPSASVDSSVITAIGAAGVYKIEPGMGWLLFQRSTSTQTVSYVGQSRR